MPVPPSSATSVRRVDKMVRLGPERTLPSTLTAPPAATVRLPPRAFALPLSRVVPLPSVTVPATFAVMAPPFPPSRCSAQSAIMSTIFLSLGLTISSWFCSIA